MKHTRIVSHLVFAVLAATALVQGVGCSSSASSTPSTVSNGCDVSFTNVQAAGATLNTSPFHDDHAIELFWNPKLKHIDVLGGDISDSPSRAFEIDLYADVPIVDGADVTLRAIDPTDAALPVPVVSIVNVNAAKLTSTGGTVHFTTASPTRLVFTITGATMQALDENRAVIPGSPSFTMAMACNIPATEDP